MIIAISLELIFPIIAVLGTIICLIYLSISKKKKQIEEVSNALLNSGYEIIRVLPGKKEITAKKDGNTIIVKIISNSPNKGIVITNKDTFFMRVYKDKNSSHIDSWKMDELKVFVNENINKNRIIVLFGGYARITKYINENELEAVTIKNDAFGTKILSFEDFCTYIKGE